MNTGILGGTFDPIHIAHLRAAEAVRETLPLERVLFIPAALQPLKTAAIAPARDRVEMVRLATASHPAFDVLELEIERGGPSYTVATLRELGQRFPDEHLWLILGSDAARELDRWREREALLSLASVAVVPRPGSADLALEELLPPSFTATLKRGAHGLLHESGHELRVVPFTPLEISATDIRERSARGASIRYLVPDPVHEYITKHRLYVEDA